MEDASPSEVPPSTEDGQPESQESTAAPVASSNDPVLNENLDGLQVATSPTDAGHGSDNTDEHVAPQVS